MGCAREQMSFYYYVDNAKDATTQGQNSNIVYYQCA